MWKGMLSPNLQKGLDPSDVWFEADDGRRDDELQSGRDDNEVGTIYITLPTSGGTTDYAWSDMEFGDFLDFQTANFSRQWMNDNLPIDYTAGGWGWAHGRTTVTGTHDWGWGEGRGSK